MTRCRTIWKKMPTHDQFIYSAMLCFIFALFFRNSEIALEGLRDGLSLCAVTVIPSLFPFMVLSDLAVSAGIDKTMGKYLGAPISKLFNVSRESGCAFILGIICGFPVGARCAVSLYGRGAISRRECERLLVFCNVPSIGFTVNVAGRMLFGSSNVGWLLYFSVVASAALTGIISGLLEKSKPIFDLKTPCFQQKKPSVSDLVRAVESSARTMLVICAYVVFFSSLIGTLEPILTHFNAPPFMRALICGGLELTCGVSECSAIPVLPLRLSLCAFFLGWSGISIHFQILSICEGLKVRFGRYLLGKILQGIICSLIALLLFTLFK